MMSLNAQASTTLRNTKLLVAAIDHLLALYLKQPKPCLSLIISRNYKLLLEQNIDHPDRKNWLNQQQIWWQCYLQSSVCKPVGDLSSLEAVYPTHNP